MVSDGLVDDEGGWVVLVVEELVVDELVVDELDVVDDELVDDELEVEELDVEVVVVVVDEVELEVLATWTARRVVVESGIDTVVTVGIQRSPSWSSARSNPSPPTDESSVASTTLTAGE